MGVVHANRAYNGQEKVADDRVRAWKLFASEYPDFAYVLTFHMRQRYKTTPEEAIKSPEEFHRMLCALVGPGPASFVEEMIEIIAAKRGIIVLLRPSEDSP